MVLPGGIYTTVRAIHTFNGEVEEACCPQSVTLLLEDDVDASRGSMIIGAERLPGGATELRARLCWMNVRALRPGARLMLKHTTSTVQAVVTTIESKLDVANLTERPGATELVLNDLGTVNIRTASPIFFDGYATNRLTGSFILIDAASNATLAAGMLEPPTTVVSPEHTDFAI
jgi:bifunctional enzyme CysN/CysC/sulfate adenylyltransferase subunit 1